MNRLTINFPNLITILRILAVPFFIWAILSYTEQKEYFRHVALGVFLFVVMSDVIDGYIARTRHQKTPVGAILDPVADKLLLISAFICIYLNAQHWPQAVHFSFWLMATIIARDLIVLLGALVVYLLHGPFLVEVTIWGKLSTFFQSAAVLSVLLNWPVPMLWYGAAAFAVVSGLDYIRQGVRILNLPRGQMKTALR